MKQEYKDLLLKDISSRLPYGVICDCLHDYHTKVSAIDVEDSTVYYPYCDEWESIQYCKPYLRPMSSMTEEEKHELLKFGTVNLDKDNNAIDVCCVGFENHAKVQDYLNSIHVDYRGLIEKGLAIEVTEENNPYKE